MIVEYKRFKENDPDAVDVLFNGLIEVRRDDLIATIMQRVGMCAKCRNNHSLI